MRKYGLDCYHSVVENFSSIEEINKIKYKQEHLLEKIAQFLQKKPANSIELSKIIIKRKK